MPTLIDLINLHLAVESGHVEFRENDNMYCDSEGPDCETCPFTVPCGNSISRRDLVHLPEYLLPLPELRTLYPEYFI